jgi:hypothetical protein
MPDPTPLETDWAARQATAMKIIEQTSSRNISTDIHATDVGVTAPCACSKLRKTEKG